jgi:hypothetical protein
MAWMFSESFDFYANTNADVLAGGWDAISGINVTGTLTRFSQGNALSGIGLTATKNNLTNESTFFFNISVYPNFNGFTGTNSQGLFFSFRDGSSSQVTVQFAADGNVYVRTGGTAGTIVGTWNGPWTALAWYHWQIKVVIHNTAGEVHIRKNGSASDDFSVTGVNTRGGTTANQVNSFSITTSNFNFVMDDILMFGSSGAAPNDWVGDVRAIQLMPTGNTAQKDFSAISTTSHLGSTAATNTKNANTQYALSWVPTENGTLTSIAVQLNAAITGHLKMALYASDAGPNPTTLLATSDEVANPGVGTVTFNFSSPPTIVGGSRYWYAFLADASFVLKTNLGTDTQWSTSRTYASGFTDPFTLTTSGNVSTPDITFTFLRANYDLVRESVEDQDTTYVFSSTAGAVDLYDLADLAVTPAAIVGLVTRQCMRKTDAGARSGTTRIKSGATSADGATLNLSTSYLYLNTVYATDPNTGAAWTAAAVNAVQVGPKVVS